MLFGVTREQVDDATKSVFEHVQNAVIEGGLTVPPGVAHDMNEIGLTVLQVMLAIDTPNTVAMLDPDPWFRVPWRVDGRFDCLLNDAGGVTILAVYAEKDG